jgi:hypothetical protein
MDPKPIEIPPGKDVTINVNSIVDFVIKTQGGTEVTGYITPNNPLKVKNGGDLAGFDIYVREAPGAGFTVVE